jgi:hypothetical protein
VQLLPRYAPDAIYVRGVARRRQGYVAGAAADIAAASAVRLGIEVLVGLGDPRLGPRE